MGFWDFGFRLPSPTLVVGVKSLWHLGILRVRGAGLGDGCQIAFCSIRWARKMVVLTMNTVFCQTAVGGTGAIVTKSAAVLSVAAACGMHPGST